MRIQFFSDLHLEFGPTELPNTGADIVIAAGDIDIRTRAIDWLCRLGKPVIYVAGNHEFWSGDLHTVYEELRAACRGTSIHFLEQNQITIGNVTYYGCTLWTDFATSHPEFLGQARLQMNDFEYISLNGRQLEPEDLAMYNQQSLRWLKKALGRKTDKKQVVVTHHAPSLKSWGFSPDDSLRFAYCNELDENIRAWNIDLWIHGHVHCRSSYSILNTRVVCNARGYHPYRLVEQFEPGKVIEVNG